MGSSGSGVRASGASGTWSGALLAASGAIVVAFALSISLGTLDPLALALVSAATIAAGLAATGSGVTVRIVRRGAVVAALAVAVGGSIAYDAAVLPGVNVDPARLGLYRPVLAVGASAVAALAWRRAPAWVRSIRFPVLLGAGLALGACVILASPEPGVDVWQMQQAAASALLHGSNPYRLAYTNVYGPGTPLIAPELLSADGRFVLGFPYTPLALLAGAPAAWVGDVRWTMLLAVGLSAVFIHRLGRGSTEASLAAALLLLQPQAGFVLEIGWTEPIVLAAVLGVALAAERAQLGGARPGGFADPWTGLALGLAVSSKQYAILIVVPLLLVIPRQARRRSALIAAVTALAIALPFLVASPRGLYRGVVEFQLLQPFRPDALSWAALLVAEGGPVLPAWPAFVLAGAILALAGRGPTSTGRSIAIGSSAWLVLVLFSKQAFCNYYWLAGGLLAAAAVAGGPARGAPATQPTAT